MNHTKITLAATLVPLLFATSELFGQATWSSSTLGGNWADTDAWTIGGSPGTLFNNGTSALIFDTASVNRTYTNNLTGFTVSGITVTSGSRDNTVTGNAITLSGDVTVSTGNFQTFNIGMGLSGNRTFTVSNGQLTLGGQVSDATVGSGIIKEGVATLILSGNNNYTGATALNDGSIVVRNNNALGSTAAGTTVTGVTTGSGAGRSLFLGNGITVTGETLTLSTASGTRASLFTNDTNGVSAWNGNVLLSAAGTAGFWVENFSTLTVGASSANTIVGTGAQLVLRGSTNSGTGRVNSSINLGGGSLVKNDASNWTLAGNNTNISIIQAVGGGSLQFANTASLFNSDTAQWTAAKINVQNNTMIAFNVGGTGEFTTGNITTLITNLATSGTNIGMNANSRLGFDTTNASGGSFTIADVIGNSTGTNGGARGLTKLGTNTLVLTGNNSYTGSTVINTGTLQLGNNSTTGALSTSSAITNNATLAFNRSNDMVQGTDFSNTLSGTGVLRKSGAGNLTLNQSNLSAGTAREVLTFAGNNSGTVTLRNASALGAAGNTVRFGSATFQGATIGNLDLQTDTTVNAYGIALGSGNGGTIIANRATSGAGFIHNLGVLDMGSATLTVSSGGNVASGTSGVSFSALRLTAGNAFGMTILGDAAVRIGNVSSTANTEQNRPLTLSGSGVNNEITGSITNGAGPGILSFTKAGSGTWTFSGTGNTYTGGTRIEAGTLRLGVNEALPSSTAITLAGGTLDAGTFDDLTLGTLTLSGNAAITLGSGAELWFADSSAATWGDFTLSIGGSFANGSSIRFGTTAGGLSQAQLAKITVGGLGGYTLDSSGFLTAIPEPSSFAVLAGLGALGFVASRRRRR